MDDQLLLTPLPGRGRGRAAWVVQRDYELSIWFGGPDHDSLDGITITVPVGTVTDFASVPRWLTWLYPPDGPWLPSAVVHDYLYQSGICSRFVADAIFRAHMTRCGVPWWRAAILYTAVRCCGWYPWRRHRTEQ